MWLATKIQRIIPLVPSDHSGAYAKIRWLSIQRRRGPSTEPRVEGLNFGRPRPYTAQLLPTHLLQREDCLNVFMYLVCLLAWGLNFIAVKIQGHVVPLELSLLYRLAFTSVVFIMLTAWLKPGGHTRRTTCQTAH